jgi:CBS domain-containing protein
MQVKEIMTASPRTVTPDSELKEVVSLMCLNRYSGLPVMEGDKMVGFIAEKDVLHKLFPTLEDMMTAGLGSVDFDQMMLRYKDIVNLKVRDLMAKNVLTVSPDDHILKAATTMVRNRFRRIPVADGEKLVGMVSLGDIHKALYRANLSQG